MGKEVLMSYLEVSKKLSYILRHNPSSVGLVMKAGGWVDVEQLLKGMGINMGTLEQIVSEDDKQRYSFSADKTMIKANQGHSIDIYMGFERAYPTAVLYHGTAQRFIESIEAEGIKSMNRQYVHLSVNKDTAIKVGNRHGKPVILTIDAKRMADDGYRFYLSDNGVWLTEHVPWSYVIKAGN